MVMVLGMTISDLQSGFIIYRADAVLATKRVSLTLGYCVSLLDSHKKSGYTELLTNVASHY